MKAIDLFAGAGGFTEGAHQAGLDVVWAANHWPAAVEIHASNHPQTDHICQDLHQANWAQVPAHDILLASPCCQGHSRSRGAVRPHHDESRSTAWAVISAAEYHRPEFLVVENVPEFLKWALYPSWADAMNRLGYSLSAHILDAADFGVPQHRVRLFLVGVRSRNPLDLKLRTRDHVPADTFIDWRSGTWSQVRKAGRAQATLDRVTNGRRDIGRRFVMAYYGCTKTGRATSRPLGTVTTRDRWALVDGPRMRMLSVDEYRQAMGFPEGYTLPSRPKRLGIHLLGNAVCPPVARELLSAIREAA